MQNQMEKKIENEMEAREYIRIMLGLYDCVGIMEKKMETTTVYWGYM